MPASPTTGPPSRDDARAYATLECARLGCARLLERARTPLLVRLLGAAHRELGMGAYMASAQLPTALRQHLYACAKWCASDPDPAVDGATEDLLMLGIRGTELTAVLRADQELGDEVSSAYGHALDAVSALAALVGAERAHELAVQALFAGQLDAERLPAVVASITAAEPAAARGARTR